MLRALDHAAPPDAPIDLDVPTDLPLVDADAGLLERVVANLVQNALRYSPAAARVADHRQRPRRAGRAAGDRPWAGHPARPTPTRSFAAFQRRGDAPSNGAGVGLGLAIARGFSEAMGGRVFAEETPGGGATLVVELRESSS